MKTMSSSSIKIYISGNSGNKEIETHQHRIFMILKSLGIEFTAVDITAPGMEDERDFMRKNGKKKEGQRNVLPPQIFNDDRFCGDYDDFDLANEDDELEEFLGIPRVTPKSLPIFKKDGESNQTPIVQNGISEKIDNDSTENGPETETTAKSSEIPSAEIEDAASDRVNANASADLGAIDAEDPENSSNKKEEDISNPDKEVVKEEESDDKEDKGGETHGGGGEPGGETHREKEQTEGKKEEEEEEAGEEEEYEYEDEEEEE